MIHLLGILLLLHSPDSSSAQFQTALDCIRRHPLIVAHVDRCGGDTNHIVAKVDSATELMYEIFFVAEIGLFKEFMNTNYWKDLDSLSRVAVTSSPDLYKQFAKGLSRKEYREAQDSEHSIWSKYAHEFKASPVPQLRGEAVSPGSYTIHVTFHPYVSGILAATLWFPDSHADDSEIGATFVFFFDRGRILHVLVGSFVS